VLKRRVAFDLPHHEKGFFCMFNSTSEARSDHGFGAIRWRAGLLCAGTLIAAAVADPIHAASQAASVTAQTTDELFSQPIVDIDEWRTTPVRHRYVHGCFKGTETCFSFYFPPRKQYRGRFFQHITPVPLSENLAQRMPPGEYNKIGFSIASGAYFVETNGGGKLDPRAEGDSTIGAYRANAAAAQYSRVVAQKMYGGQRPYGYAYGGSGGGYRTIGGVENTQGVWDGVVPYVIGSVMAIPNVFTVRLHAMRILNDKLPQIADAMEPGGSGDPFVGLNGEEAAALREATRMGFPLPTWFGYRTMDLHGLAALYSGVVAADRAYFTDFWSKPGYLGFDHPEQLAKARVQYKSTVVELITAAQAQRVAAADSAFIEKGGVNTAFRKQIGDDAQRIVAIRLREIVAAAAGYLNPGDLTVLSGAAKGKTLLLGHITGDTLALSNDDASVAAQLAPGDEVLVDNSNFLALQTYHRHQAPTKDFKAWDQFRGPDGQPLYPQRPMLLGPMFVKATSGSLLSGKFAGKMIVVASLWDREAFPWQADWYRSRVQGHFGDKTDDHFRLWYTDHALHGDEPRLEDPTRVVSYEGVLQQALRDLSAWVEKGVAPPASTGYTIDEAQVIVPPTAALRRGIQPVVTLTANGAVRAEVAAGQEVTFKGAIAVPPGTGSVVAAEWEFDGTGAFAASSDVPQEAGAVNVSITHRFDKPGTYFPALRGVSQREGDKRSPYARIPNLGRVRVVVR
jgi:hypothetical protein